MNCSRTKYIYINVETSSQNYNSKEKFKREIQTKHLLEYIHLLYNIITDLFITANKLF